jgi:hypothetical protein
MWQPGSIVKTVGFGPMLVGATLPLSFDDDTFSTNYPISNKNELPTIKSIGFVLLGLLIRLKDWASIIFDEIL